MPGENGPSLKDMGLTENGGHKMFEAKTSNFQVSNVSDGNGDAAKMDPNMIREEGLDRHRVDVPPTE